MPLPNLGSAGHQAMDKVLGYLNFSSGRADSQFLASLDALFRLVVKDHEENGAASLLRPLWAVCGDCLQGRLDEVDGTTSAFSDTTQARDVLSLVFGHVLEAYRDFHAELFFHQSDEFLFQPLFIGRVCEAVLQEGAPWDETDRITEAAIRRLNDFVGYRPIAALETHRHEPYDHEKVRPIPLFIVGAGVAQGPYRTVIESALEILQQTDPHLLREAYFDVSLLDELAVDPRAYDFDHPVNKRPNYHFGLWDPHHLDGEGRYRRFVVQQVAIEALLCRVTEPSDLPAEQLHFEAAAVLAGTILMASGISGSSPESHDSTINLIHLLPTIARYRDVFYQQLVDQLPAEHQARLREETTRLHQPFAAARQHLNAELSRRRATQLEHVQLAKVFARMGYPDAAAEQAAVVPVASARIVCQIDCQFTTLHQDIDNEQLESAAARLPTIIELIQRGIQCGAIVDPWNILGFDANFSLFRALENSVHDHRVDELLRLIEELLSSFARVWSEAAAIDDRALCDSISIQFEQMADWWHQFAAHEVSSVDAIDAKEAYKAAQHVAEALNLWNKGGAAAGDIGFWAPHAAMFDSPKAYSLVVESLLEKGDFVASRALLVHWLEQAERVGLQQGNASFFDQTTAWLRRLTNADAVSSATPGANPGDDPRLKTWSRIKKLFDYFEANAEQYWCVPDFDLGEKRPRRNKKELEAFDAIEEDDEEESLFGAAYDEVVYRDSTDDGFDGEIFDVGTSSEDELEEESRRITRRLAFLTCLARLWKGASGYAAKHLGWYSECSDTLLSWFSQASINRQELMGLLADVGEFSVRPVASDPESLVEYDRRRSVKETLLERIISTAVEMADASRLVLTAYHTLSAAEGQGAAATDWPKSLARERQLSITLLAAIVRSDTDAAKEAFVEYRETIVNQPLLYVPLSRGGNPNRIVACRVRQRTMQNLFAWLPRLCLLSETRSLLETARLMEHRHPAGPGAVTEYDELFRIGYRAMVDCLVHSAIRWQENIPDDQSGSQIADSALIGCLEQMTQVMIEGWLSHSRTLRLSVLEQLGSEKRWQKIVEFTQRYGADLFTQRFLQIGNLRAILHQGVDNWLEQLQREAQYDTQLKLLEELGSEIQMADAVRYLTLIFEAIVESYGEYRDYNATTTQSDQGDLLYCLLDFLRLRTNYDRVIWNLRPVALAHETLVRRGRNRAAELWRRALAERFRDEADRFQLRLGELQAKYAMRMPTVADRISERFILPMTIDRICALIGPAMIEANSEGPTTSFDLLQQEAMALAKEPTGVGLDAPGWLVALEDEVERQRRPLNGRAAIEDLPEIVAQKSLPIETLQAELDRWSNSESD